MISMENRELVVYNVESGETQKNIDEMLKSLHKDLKGQTATVRLPKGSWKYALFTFLALVVCAGLFLGLKQVKPAHVKNITIDKLWEYKTLGPVFATPAICRFNHDRINEVLVNSMDGKFYVLDGMTGKRVSYFETGGPLLSSPALLRHSNGEIWAVIAGEDRKIYALSGDNRCQWASIDQYLDAPVISTPLPVKLTEKSESIVCAAKDGKIYAFDGDRGWLLWKSRETFGKFFSTPAAVFINNDRVPDLIIGSPENRVYGIDGRTGLKIWEIPTAGAVNSSPVVLDSEIFFIADETGNLYKINYRTGVIIGQINLSAPVISTPALINKNEAPVLVVPLKNGTISACSAVDLHLVWNYDTKYQDPIVSSPAVYDLNNDGCEDVVITSRNGYLYLLNGKDGSELMPPFFTGNSISSSPVLADINNDGYLEAVFGSENGYVYAFTIKTVPDRIVHKNQIVYGSFLNRDNANY